MKTTTINSRHSLLSMYAVTLLGAMLLFGCRGVDPDDPLSPEPPSTPPVPELLAD